MYSRIPKLHEFAYKYASIGLLGSSIIWKFVRLFKTEKNGEKILLPSGFPLIIDNKDWIARTIYEGTYERPLLNFLTRLSAKNLFLDVGANIGVTLWNGLLRSDPTTTYVAVEPSEQCQAGLDFTTQHLNRSGRILKVALGDKSEEKVMHGLNNLEQSGGASLLANKGLRGDEEIVQVRTVDELILEGEISQPIFLLKIDTEGYEKNVLAGSSELISRFEVCIFILEVSPSFCSTDWVLDLYNKIESHYSFYRLIEKGIFRQKTRIQEIGIDEALQIPDQWNLVILHNNFFQHTIEVLKIKREEK